MSGASSSGLGDFPLVQLRRVIEVRDRFEAALLSGRSPLIESYLAESVDLDRVMLLRELLSLEVEYRSRSGWSPAPGEYLERFPDQATLVVSVFEEVTFSTIGSGTPPGSADPETTEESVDPDAPTITHVSSVRPERHDRSAAPGDRPETIGRYRVAEVLGEGGFGRVFKAFDTELGRWVAIKVPHPSRIRTPRDLESYFTEARILASLDHPGIVPVFDVGRTEEGSCFIVSKLIEGHDLATRLRMGRPTSWEAASQVATIAEAAHHAHTRNLVHRDIKARNILIDGAGRPYLADFGLALKEEDFGKGPIFAGTPVYMSPEQARGEGHRVDGRSDIFSLGVVFYEMLAGTRPFKGGTWEETIERIKTQEVRPPRQFDDSIPRELERICLKALAKRVTDRYATALDMADDLRHALALIHPSSTHGLISGLMPQGHEADISSLALHIVPKGLRCFEAEDAGFFVRLLPGPRDRDDLPDSLRFWKSRIEATEDERAFRVGLVYGPSGCGKSSFVKAGLMPRLEASVTSILIEATPNETESRLESALRRRFDTLPAEARLPDLLATIRRGASVAEGGKVLLVIDQFEQWLHANRSTEDSDLVQALRQCDGVRLQCLLIVRDDFWMSVTRFMQELEVRLVEGENSAAVDLFSERHAKKVLAAFGRAFEVLPADPAKPKKDQLAFIDRAVAGLAQDGKVVCVQLSLFAEMVKNKAWTVATLKDVGGTQGVGITFLDETFSAVTSPPEYRRHQRAVREVLRALLPERGTEIKGHMRSRGKLLEASGYTASPRDFEELLLILDKDLRLITPTDPQGDEPGEVRRGLETHYQLTHDYLVPSLRDWLTKKQRETKRGRAEIRLAERTALWGTKRERRQLPSFLEWLDIRLHTRRTRWNEREAQMMRAAKRDHMLRISRLLVVLILATAIARESSTYLRATVLVDQLFAAETAKVPEIIRQMESYRRWVNPLLRERKSRSRGGSDESLHASLALLPVDRGQELDLINQLLDAEPPKARIIRDAFAPGTPAVKANFWRVLENVLESNGRRLRAACVLALYDPDNPNWATVAPDVVSALTGEDLFSIPHWSELLHPVRERLRIPLTNAFLMERDNQQGYVAASLLAEYTTNRHDSLLELIQAADPRQLRLLLSAQTPASKPVLATRVNQALSEPIPPNLSDKELDQLAQRRANLAIAEGALGDESKLWPRLENKPDPRLRTYLIVRLAGFEVEPLKLLERVKREPVPSVRQALVLCLGGFDDTHLPLGIRDRLLPDLVALYREDSDPGVHSALDWLLGKWDHGDQARKVDLELRGKPPKPGQGWRVNNQGQTMVVVDGPLEFLMGSPPGEVDREPLKMDETQHARRIGRSFEIASREVTIDQFLRSRLVPDNGKPVRMDKPYPMTEVTFYAAAKYCRWLSDREGIPEEEMCYPKAEEIKHGFQMVPGYLSRTGYRLPTEAEWEAACRAGTTTSRFYGSDSSLLYRYAWSTESSGDRLHPVGETMPNPLGLFDMLGNVYEHCLGPDPRTEKYPRGPVDDIERNVGLPKTIFDPTFIAIRGGAYHRSNEASRAACRNGDHANHPNIRIGFRVVRTLRTFASPEK